MSLHEKKSKRGGLRVPMGKEISARVVIKLFCQNDGFLHILNHEVFNKKCQIRKYTKSEPNNSIIKG